MHSSDFKRAENYWRGLKPYQRKNVLSFFHFPLSLAKKNFDSIPPYEQEKIYYDFLVSKNPSVKHKPMAKKKKSTGIKKKFPKVPRGKGKGSVVRLVDKHGRQNKTYNVDRDKSGHFKKFTRIAGVKKHTDLKSHNVKISIGAIPNYNDPDSAREIQLYADNNYELYRSRKQPLLKNSKRKLEKGIWNRELATKLWLVYVTDAMKKYNKEFGTRNSKWSSLLSPNDRWRLAYEYALATEEEYAVNKLE
jgi:hypothetical protein